MQVVFKKLEFERENFGFLYPFSHKRVEWKLGKVRVNQGVFCCSPYPDYLFHPILLLWQNGWVGSKLAEAWRIYDGGLMLPSGRTRSDGQDNTQPLPLWKPCHHLLLQKTLIYPDGRSAKQANTTVISKPSLAWFLEEVGDDDGQDRCHPLLLCHQMRRGRDEP